MDDFLAVLVSWLGLAFLGAFMFFLAAPASWREMVETPVMLECAAEGRPSKPVSFTPRLGGIIYDGASVSGEVSSAAVTFQFRNINGALCDWTISRISGAAKTSCIGEDGKYAVGELQCAVNVPAKF